MTDLATAEGFAAGPYEQALRMPSGPLMLHDAVQARITRVDIDRFLGAPAEPERRLIEGLAGPVLDIGCGPGRMLHAALSAGLRALGVDISPAAVEIAHARGLPAVHGSVFDPLPDEGQWGAALLLDGNVGIGGDPAALLARCAALLRPGGRIVVETHAERHRDRRFHGVLSNADGVRSAPFPWAEVGRRALRRYAEVARVARVREWTDEGRSFAEYVTPGVARA